jgi:tetratricopeptide (TPR) repeat protein
VVEHLAQMLAEQCRAEDTLGARRLRPTVLAQLEVIDHLAADTPEPVCHGLLVVGSHCQQFTAWLAQDAMDTAAAGRHYAAAEYPDQAPPWVYFNAPDQLAFQREVAYMELGRYSEAAELLSAALENLGPDYDRDRGRYAGMLALALAGGREVGLRS